MQQKKQFFSEPKEKTIKNYLQFYN
jgi:hypothetical protein